MWAIDMLLTKGLICVGVMTILYINFVLWAYLMSTAVSLNTKLVSRKCSVGLHLIWLTSFLSLLKMSSIIISISGVLFFGVEPVIRQVPWLIQGVM